MKKTTNIHLAGILFNIEEDAYQLLEQYIQSIENYFSQSKGRKEILEDIESRMAELLSEKLHAGKQVITLNDVQEAISIMGKTEDFGTEENTQQQETYSVKKRFYRNPDDKVIGGVCGGIAAYFDIDPLWIRLAWAISFFVFGTGLLFYILLWIIIPEAKTPSQKLEMRGEKINISNISKGISGDLNQFGKKASKEFSNISGSKLSAFIQNIFQYVIDFIYGTGKVIMKIFAVFFVLVFAFILIVLMASLFGDNYVVVNSNIYSISAALNDFFVNPFESILFSVAVFLLIGIPLLLVLAGLIKFIFNIKRKVKYAGITALILWLIGWGLLVYSVVGIAETYSEKSSQTSYITQYLIPGKSIYLKMTEDEDYIDEERFKVIIANKVLFSDNKNNASIGFPSVFIRKSKDDSLRIKIISSAVAESKKQAKQYAQNIQYKINYNDSIIELASKYDIPKEDKFHFQRIRIIVEIPQNRYVYFSKNMKYYLSEAENNIDADENDMLGKKWLMGIDHLICTEQCDEIKNIHHKHHHKRKHQTEEQEIDDEE